MARGYLGKISAVISANTGDYVRKLNESAKETAAFARTVQQTLGRASSEASKSLEGIYTPLQKVERALRAAASQKLAFRGFDGAIRDVQSLQSAIAKLTDKKTIDLVVKTSGVGSLDELKRTIGVLRNQDVTIGVEGLRQQRAALGNTKNFVVKTEVREEGKRLDDVIEALERIDSETLKKISLQVEAQQLDAAALKLRQLVSAGKEIGEPLERAAKQYASLSLSVQAAFGPALKRAQQATESLTAAIDSGATISQRKFAALRREVELTEAAVKRLDAAESVISRLGDGRSLRDVAPRQFDALNAAAAVQQRSSALSGQAAAGFGVGRQEAAVRRQAEILNQMRARQESLRQSGGDTSEIDAAIERQTARLEKQVAVWQRLVAAAEDYEQIVALRSKGGFVSSEDLASTGRRKPDDSTPLGNRLSKNIASEISTLRSQLIGLGEVPLVASLGPQFDELSNRMRLLTRDAVTTERQVSGIWQAVGQARGIREAIDARQTGAIDFARGAGGRGSAGLDVGIDEKSLRGIGAQIDFVQTKLAGLSLEARGPAVAALERYRLAAANAFQDGRFGTQQAQRALEAYRNEVIRVTASVAGISARRLASDLKKTGDIARGAFGNMGLAIQQAAFAFEDFFSVTGGLDQRIRAAGNNISQLGFILGGAWGLGVGIAISVGTQFTLMLIDWYNEGRKTEDRLKSLNDTLEKQKNTVQELAEAYGKVVDRIREAGASRTGRREEAIRQQVEDVRKRQREGREQRILGASPEVQDARATVAARERELGQASTAAARVRAQLRLEQDRRRLREQEQQTLAAGGRPSRDEIATTVRRVVPDAGFLISQQTRDEISQKVEARLAAAGDDPQRQLEALRAARATQASVSSNWMGRNVIAPNSEEVLVALDQLVARLESSEQGAKIDKALSGITKNALQIADVMEVAGDAIQQAFEGSIGASAIESEIAAFSESLASFVTGAQEAAERGDMAAAAAFSQDVTYIQRHIEALKNAAIALGQLTQALQRAQQAVQQDVEAARGRLDEARRLDTANSTPRRRDEVAIAERQLQDQQAAARQAELEIERQRAQQDDEAMRASALLERRDQLRGPGQLADRASRLATIADQALVGSGVEFGKGYRSTAKRARAAGRDDIAAKMEEAADAIVEASEALGIDANKPWLGVQKAIEDFKKAESDVANSTSAQFQQAVKEIADIEKQLGGSLTGDARQQLLERRAALQQQIQPELDRRERAAAEARAIGQRTAEVSALQNRGREILDRQSGRDAADQLATDFEAVRQEFGRLAEDTTGLIDNEGVRKAQQRLLAESAPELLTPGQQAAAELEKQISRIQSVTAERLRADEMLGGGNESKIRQEEQEAIKRARLDAMRNAAPTIFGLADSVQNAILQGPSRAALQATDVSTVEGSRELTRLLRGDDAARDQANLVELQKEANRLLDLIANAPAPVAN